MTFLAQIGHELAANPLKVIPAIFGCIFIYASLLVTYRLFFHPLARYPGPFLAKCTDLYLTYHAWKGDRHLEFYRCHDRYGHVVRIGPNFLSFDTNTALKSIYGHKSNVRKADFYTAFPANKNTFNVHSAINKQAHSRKRRVISNAFADSAIKSMEKYVLQNIKAATNLLTQDTKKSASSKEAKATWSASRNMSNWCDWLTFDIMGDLVFGKSFNMLNSDQNRFAINLVSSAAHRHLICGTHLTIHNYHLDKIFFRKIAEQRAKFMVYSKAQAAERSALGPDAAADRRDFFHYLLNARDPETGEGFTPNELWGESNLFIIAGSDTTSTAMAAAFHYLVNSPSALATATAEVRAAFTSADEIVSSAELTTCRFLRACINESMRLAPPVAGGLPRQVLGGGLKVEGHMIPKGMDVCVPHYAIHHNKDYYPRPFAFLPERWLTAEKLSTISPAPELAEKLAEAQAAFCPFSIGPRGCIGKGLAYVELMMTMARVLWMFDIRLDNKIAIVKLSQAKEEEQWCQSIKVDNDENRVDMLQEYKLKDTFTSMKNGPEVQFRARTFA